MIVGAAGPAIFTACTVTLACFIVAWPTYRIVSMWLMNELTGLETAAGVVVLLAFLGGIMATWGSSVNLLLWVMLIIVAVMFSLGGRVRDKRRLAQFFREDVAAAQKALQKDPDNAAAHMRLGDLYERHGELEKAVEHFEACSRILPRDSEAKLRLAGAVEKRRRQATGGLVCWRCGRENADTAAFCAGCGALISDRNHIVQCLTSRLALRTIGVATGISLLAAIAGSLLRAIPSAVTGLSFMLLFLCVLCYVYPRWARLRSG